MQESTKSQGFARPDEFGIKDMLLAYIPGNLEENENISKETMLPHVAYIINNEIKDTLFDSYLFLPVVKFLYEGYEKRQLKKTDWLKYINSQFMTGRNLDALENSVEKTMEKLNNSQYKVKVFFSVFYPVESVNDFGVINGINLDFSKPADQIVAVKWMIDKQIELFLNKGYRNIELGGFYWFTESIDTSNENLVKLVENATNYVRKTGFRSFWIPYFGAPGYDMWEKLGFDFACYQPNYAFNFSVPKQRLYDAISDAKRLNMCLEIEVGRFTADDVARVSDYFEVAKKTNVMEDSIHMYYQGAVPGVVFKSYISEDPYLHSFYTDLYKFIKDAY